MDHSVLTGVNNDYETKQNINQIRSKYYHKRNQIRRLIKVDVVSDRPKPKIID